tara:strand:- start:4960 stop:6177 length:1218 start_codon:yes stop_codon:yes gene_type:complete
MKKFLVFTGNRAEFGLISPIIEEMDKDKKIQYKLIVSGAHLNKKFGDTKQEIKKLGYKSFLTANIKISDKYKTYTALSISKGIEKISRLLTKYNPDALVVYADRFEGFAAVIAGSQMNIPTIHIEGGDITEGGALDDSVRHAMTKLSHFHFTTNAEASKRIIAMGEEKWRVKTIGFPAVDLIKNKNYATPKELIKKFNLNLKDKIIIFTQHSITTEYKNTYNQLKASIDALEQIAKKNIKVIITYPNNDIGSDIIIKFLKKKKYVNNKNLLINKSLGRYYYHGLLALNKNINFHVCCAGNSSSGIKETPIFGCPTVNIGSRQQGRLRAKNVIDVDYNSNSIFKALKKALFNKNFINKCYNCYNPYGIGNSGIKMIKFLKEVKYTKSKILRKKMTLTKNFLNKARL